MAGPRGWPGHVKAPAGVVTRADGGTRVWAVGGVAEELLGRLRAVPVFIGIVHVWWGGSGRGQVAAQLGQAGHGRHRHPRRVAGGAFVEQQIDPAQPDFGDEPVDRGGVVGVVHGEQVARVWAVGAVGVVGSDHEGGRNVEHDGHVAAQPDAQPVHEGGVADRLGRCGRVAQRESGGCGGGDHRRLPSGRVSVTGCR